MRNIKKIFKNLFGNIQGKDRFYLIKIILFFAMFLLFIRLAFLTLIKGNYYRDLSENSRIREVEVVAPRGNIYDRNGEILAGNQTVYTASIMKDEFSHLDTEEKNRNLLNLSRYLELDGADFNSEYSISYNIIEYKSDEDYGKEDETPIEKTVKLISENNLMPEIIKGEYEEKTKDGKYKYRIVDTVIKSIKKKGLNIPLNSGDEKIEFTETEKNEFLKDNNYVKDQSPYDFLGQYTKEDESIIRSILNHPVGRKICYDALKSKELQGNLVLKDMDFIEKELLLETKSSLEKKYENITFKSKAEDDFVEIVKNSTLDELLGNVTINATDKNNVVVPAKIAIKLLDENGVRSNITVDVDEKDVNNPLAIIKYKSDENKDVKAEDALKSLLIENDLLKEFIMSDDIKFIAQNINTKNNITPSISVKDWKYSYEINMEDLYEINKVDKDDGVKKLYDEIIKKYEIEDYSKYDAYNILTIYDKIAKHGDLRYIPIDLTYNISETTFAKIEENFKDDSGIFIDSESIRYYPYGDLASHTLGYMGKISTQGEIDKYIKGEKYTNNSIIGKIGIEESQELQLKGTNGFKRVMVDNRGNTTETLDETKPIPGKDVYTSIDTNIQKKVEDVLLETINSLTGDNVYNSDWGDENMVSSTTSGQYTDATSGAVVVLDAKTGQVIALANKPDINLNMFATGISGSDWKSLFPKNEEDQFAPRPLLNIAMQSAIQPGSTFKLVSSLAALETGVDPNHTITCNGFIDVGGRKFQDAIWGMNFGMHGSESLKEAIRDSCNVYFYNLVLGIKNGSYNGNDYKINVDDIAKYSKMLGLGEKTGIDINIPSESIGTVPDKKIKKARDRNLYINFLKENAKDYLEDKNISKEKLDDKITEMTSWIDEEVLPSETEINNRLKKLGFDTKKKNKNDKTLSAIIKYDYINQSEWLVGDSLNVVIGQGQNAYTPLQMARYMSTIANGGYKNKVSVVDKIVDSSTNTTTYKNTPSSEKINLKDYGYLETIKEGTNMAANDSMTSNSRIFGKLPFEVGIKTGTAQLGYKNPTTGKEYDDHGWVIGFAPYDDPQYVVAAVVTQSGTSSNITPMMRDIFATLMDKYPKGTNNGNNSEESDE